MVLSKRERYITIAVLAAAGLLLLDTLLLGPYLDWRSSLVAQSKSQAIALTEAQNAIQQEQHLRKTLAGMDASMTSDSSSAEAQLHHVMHDWEQQATLTNASFERVRTIEEHGLIHLTYRVAAEGDAGAMAMLLYRIETTPIPLRIDDLHVTVKGDSDNLQIVFNISSLCRGRNLPAPHTVADNQTAGGWQ
jgi:hypothetical protein